MPAKRRIAKRRISPAAELQAWSELFDIGHDFFNDLAPLGFPGGDGDARAREAARKAWRRLGAAFMETFQPDGVRSQPWAVEEFGYPKGWRDAG
jgi:hypothetical protein